MEITVLDSLDQLTHVAVGGRLDLQSAPQLERELMGISARQRPVIMDLSGVEFLASLAIGLLVTCARGLAGRNQRMVFLNPAPLVERALRTTSVDLLVPIFSDLEQARAHVANG